jgi:excisionase family DNA binding protein
MTDVSQLLTAREAAGILRISTRKLFDLQAKGEVQAIRIGRSIRYEREELQRYIASLRAKVSR